MSPDDFDAWEPQSPSPGFAERVVKEAQRERAASSGGVRRRWARVGVGVVLVGSLAAGVAFVTHLQRLADHGDVAADARREVRVGSRAVAVLEPGARVTWDGARVQQTAGDVFWRVEPGARFVVSTPGGEVTVKGTCFRVKVAAGVGLAAAVAVSVYEGKVALSKGGASVELAAGESAEADPTGVHATTLPTGSEPPRAEAASEHAVAQLDRARADRMRQELHALFSEAGPAAVPAPPPPPSATMAYRTMPMIADDAGGTNVDPEYLQSVIRQDYFPLAKQCYTNALERNPKLGGRVEVSFKILGDKKVGGVIDDAKLTEGTTIDDEEMRTCIRESMLSVTFDAPPEDGEITVVYPIEFSNEDDDGGK